MRRRYFLALALSLSVLPAALSVAQQPGGGEIKSAISADDVPITVIKHPPQRVAPSAPTSNAASVQTPNDRLLDALLNKADVFFKRTYNDAIQRWEYKVAWSESGETSPMALTVRELGVRPDGTSIPLVYCWTLVVATPDGKEVPPAVLKRIAELNDALLAGNLSLGKGGVYANVGLALENLSPQVLWTHLWDLHNIRRGAKPELEKLITAG